MNARATRIALIAASVPELTNRTRSIDGISVAHALAELVLERRWARRSWCRAAPRRDRLDQAARRVAVNQRPPRHHVVDEAVAVDVLEDRARTRALMNSGVPPTAWNARTGLSTPPGRIWLARAKSFCDVDRRFIRSVI